MYLIKTSAIWGFGEIFLFLFLGQDSRALTEYRVTHMYSQRGKLSSEN